MTVGGIHVLFSGIMLDGWPQFPKKTSLKTRQFSCVEVYYFSVEEPQRKEMMTNEHLFSQKAVL